MTAVDRWLFGIQIVEATIAVAVNWWCATKVPNHRVAQIFGAVGTLAAAYVILLSALLAGWVEPAGTITAIRGLSLVAWPLVWIAPPLLVTAAVPKFRRTLVAQVVELLTADDQSHPVPHG